MTVTLPAHRRLSQGSKVKIGERVVYLKKGANEGATGTLKKTKNNDYYWGGASPKWQVNWDNNAQSVGLTHSGWYSKTDFGYVLDQSPVPQSVLAIDKQKGEAIVFTPRGPVTRESVKKGDRLRVVAGASSSEYSPLKVGDIVTYDKPASWGGRLAIQEKSGYGFLPKIFEFADSTPSNESPEQLVNRLFEAKVKAMDAGIEEIRTAMLKSIKDEINRTFNIKVK